MLLKDPLIEGFFTTFDHQIFERWANTPDTATRDELYMLKIASDALKAHLRSYVLTGQIEKGKSE